MPKQRKKILKSMKTMLGCQLGDPGQIDDRSKIRCLVLDKKCQQIVLDKKSTKTCGKIKQERLEGRST